MRTRTAGQEGAVRFGSVRCGRGVLMVTGELDMATAPTVASQLLHDRSIRVVDLAGVTFIDAAGLGVLRDGIRGTNRPILIRRASPSTLRLLAIVGLDHTTLEPPMNHTGPSDP